MRSLHIAGGLSAAVWFVLLSLGGSLTAQAADPCKLVYHAGAAGDAAFPTDPTERDALGLAGDALTGPHLVVSDAPQGAVATFQPQLSGLPANKRVEITGMPIIAGAAPTAATLAGKPTLTQKGGTAADWSWEPKVELSRITGDGTERAVAFFLLSADAAEDARAPSDLLPILASDGKWLRFVRVTIAAGGPGGGTPPVTFRAPVPKYLTREGCARITKRMYAGEGSSDPAKPRRQIAQRLFGAEEYRAGAAMEWTHGLLAADAACRDKLLKCLNYAYTGGAFGKAAYKPEGLDTNSPEHVLEVELRWANTDNYKTWKAEAPVGPTPTGEEALFTNAPAWTEAALKELLKLPGVSLLTGGMYSTDGHGDEMVGINYDLPDTQRMWTGEKPTAIEQTTETYPPGDPNHLATYWDVRLFSDGKKDDKGQLLAWDAEVDLVADYKLPYAVARKRLGVCATWGMSTSRVVFPAVSYRFGGGTRVTAGWVGFIKTPDQKGRQGVGIGLSVPIDLSGIFGK